MVIGLWSNGKNGPQTYHQPSGLNPIHLFFYKEIVGKARQDGVVGGGGHITKGFIYQIKAIDKPWGTLNVSEKRSEELRGLH